MGAWTFLHSRFGVRLAGRDFICISRPESASPAIGSEKGHKHEQAELIEKAFGYVAGTPPVKAEDGAKSGAKKKLTNPVAVS